MQPTVLIYLSDQQVREAHDSIKTSTPAEMVGWGPRPGVERSGTPGHGSIKNGEPAQAGGSLRLNNAPFRSAAAPLRGLGSFFVLVPGAHAPGFTLTCAPSTRYRSVKYVNA
jgi:hypothetical protein